jgi:hypothetical protein
VMIFAPGPPGLVRLYMRWMLRFPGGGGGSKDLKVEFKFGGGVRGSDRAEKDARIGEGVV